MIIDTDKTCDFGEPGGGAIALLNLGDWVPRSRSFDVAVSWRILLNVLARPRQSSVTVAPQFEKGDGPGRAASAHFQGMEAIRRVMP